jgi:hypothetical protein
MPHLRKCAPEEMPGYRISPHRTYVYVESTSSDEFRNEFPQIGDEYTGELPTGGGMINEEAAIHVTAPSLRLCCVSCKGDTAGWLRVITTYCARHDRLHASINEDGVTLSDGMRIPWPDCETFKD